MRNGFKLDLPSGETFVSTTEVETTLDQDVQFLFDGANQILALFEQYIQNGPGGPGDGLGESAFLGSGARVQRITVEFERNIDSSESWGESSAGDPAVSQRDTLNRALETVSLDSTKTATLAWGEYSETGKYAPKDVVLEQSTLPSGLEQGASSFRGTLDFLEAADFENVIHGADRTE